jgi:hypothetical protein
MGSTRFRRSPGTIAWTLSKEGRHHSQDQGSIPTSGLLLSYGHGLQQLARHIATQLAERGTAVTGLDALTRRDAASRRCRLPRSRYAPAALDG